MFRIRLLLGTKLGSNIAYSFKLGVLPKRVTRALGLAKDTGSGAFLYCMSHASSCGSLATHELFERPLAFL